MIRSMRTRSIGLAVVALPLTACVPNNPTGEALAALTATTAGSLVQIVLQGFFTRQLTTGENLDTGVPISQQQK